MQRKLSASRRKTLAIRAAKDASDLKAAHSPTGTALPPKPIKLSEKDREIVREFFDRHPSR